MDEFSDIPESTNFVVRVAISPTQYIIRAPVPTSLCTSWPSLVGGAALRLLMEVGIIITSDEKNSPTQISEKKKLLYEYLPTRVTAINPQLIQCQPNLNCTTTNNNKRNERMDGQARGERLPNLN